MEKQSPAQKRFFDALYQRENPTVLKELDALADDMDFEEDRSRFGLSTYLSELSDIEATPSKNAVKPFLKNPEKESTGFVLSLSSVLEENPQLIDVMTEQKMKISSKDVPDPDAGKPFRSETSAAWDKAIKNYIVNTTNKQKTLARMASSRRSHTA